MGTIEITVFDDDGNEVTMDLPSRKVVCPECRGEGFVLCSGMRDHAYSQEEFYQSFSEEEREHYFRRGGMYDVKCPKCKGANVVDAVDTSACDAAQLAHYKAFIAQEREREAFERECRAERSMGA